MKRILSRRELIKGTATIGAASLLGLSVNGAQAIPPHTVPSWDDEADVVIVGFGEQAEMLPFRLMIQEQGL